MGTAINYPRAFSNPSIPLAHSSCKLIEMSSTLLLLLAFLLVQPCIPHLSHSSNNFTDQSALIAFKSQITFGPNVTVFAGGNWSTTTNFCEWFGVSCSRRRQRVTALDLSYVGIHGTISPHIANLSFLVSLDLSNNSFNGFLPHEISRLHRLRELVLSNNLLEGTLPMDVCTHCPSLQELDISANEFSGKLSSQFNHCRELLILSLSYNKFDGSISKGFGSLEKLELLYLGGNNLTGNIPPIISNLSMSQEFYIEENYINGSIPSDLWRLQNLIILNFEQNYLTGTIPQIIFNITSLKALSLAMNSLSGNLPLDTRISCSNLETLFLDLNQISGHIPSYLSNCSNLIQVDFAGNLLSGPIPKSLGNLKYLKSLVLNVNQLTEEPVHQEHNFLTSLTSCRFLEELAISINPLNITIPKAIGNFSASLKGIYAGEGQINGRIPMEISSLKNLAFLDLSYNNLVGNIPSSFGEMEGCKDCILVKTILEEEFQKSFVNEDMVAHVGDFGIAKILVENKDATQTKTIGTIGYIAPEYGSEGRVSTKGDIYSYGIILLEMITRKKPTDEMFIGELGMRQWIASLLDKMEIVDHGLLRREDGRDVIATQTILSSILELGLRCSEELPDARLDIKDVVAKVNKIKLALLGNQNMGI
ncbi:hypothetical protein CMV_007098 [Castanea mollissima]|uniref:Protein kinase domain-containing protein n=1 Tax=Castanea mollissima TaxID=60419 RepID=A0A8J4W0J7_9ROSI|nr:hypothetical protein CMV_007098 [Castanea mollissima]